MIGEFVQSEKVAWSIYLHFNIQDANTAFLANVLHGLYTGSVKVAAELSVLDEAVFVDQFQECFLRCEVVVFAVGFAGARGAGSICEMGRSSARLRMSYGKQPRYGRCWLESLSPGM